MDEHPLFLSDKMAKCDAVLLTVTDALHPQVLRARLLRIYCAGKAIQAAQEGDEIEFVHAPAVYGNVAIQVGETAVLFLSDISGRWYEDAWRGHMVVEDIDGVPHAIFPHLVVSANAASPSSRSIQDPKRAYARAIALDDLERYLRALAP